MNYNLNKQASISSKTEGHSPIRHIAIQRLLTHCGRVTQICVFNMVKLGTSASSP
jgi:hypothetical protein